MPTPNISKSKYIKYCQCAKALWLKVNNPDAAEEDSQAKERLAAGQEVGALARGLFGEYTNVTTLRADGSLDIAAMIKSTQDCINSGVDVICEASFSANGCYCATDILRKTANGYAIYEVKSSTSKEENDSKGIDEYLPDIAYQKWVLTQCGVNVTGTYLIRINSGYVRGEELDIEELFNIQEIEDDTLQNEYSKIKNNIIGIQNTLSSNTEPDIDLCEGCNKPRKCEFFKYCTRNIASPSVFDLYRAPFSKKLKLYQNGKISFEDLRTESELTEFQHMQVECTLQNQSYINHDEINSFLSQLSYPLYFLDFETLQQVIPQYPGTKPYQQIPFQYSLHYIENEGGELKHKEFLGISGTDTRRALAERLCEDIPTDVCVTAYNKSFECTRIKELAKAFPDLSGHLLNIQEHIVDLLDPFSKGHYYVPAMGSSTSIKHVLPALCPNDPKLDYHNLDSRCQNGANAMTIFPKIKDMAPEEAAASREALLRYCELDTYAMVKVWEKLVTSSS